MAETEKQATFYLRGNHEITLDNIGSVTMTRDNETGSYAAYTIEWFDQSRAPHMFTMSLPDIVAVRVISIKVPD